MILQGQGFSLNFPSYSSKIKEVTSQGELVFEGITRTTPSTIPGILGARTQTRGGVVFNLDLDINQFTLGKKYSLGLKLEARVIPGEADFIHPPDPNPGSLASSSSILTISSGSIRDRTKVSVNPFQPWGFLVSEGVEIKDDNLMSSLPLDASFEESSDFVDIRDRTDDNLMVSITLQGKFVSLKRVVLTKRESA